MPTLKDEPALGFWLRYAEREGALVESGGDHALLLLPRPLAQASELPEEVTVTADPDIARADGAELLIAGHPALDRAAATVLAEGDTGHAFLPWPGSRPPTRSALEARARELVAIEHGRIDATGEPSPAYAPMLRVGAMISYAASLTLRFQELEEAWVDACSGLAPGARVLAMVRDAARLPEPDSRHRALKPELSVALPPAHEQLARRATARQATLGVQAQRALGLELARADCYYEAALDSIERRRPTATAERVRLLDAQAHATRVEQARRRREIEEEFSARHEIRPFRLHLVYVPVFLLPVEARRGSRPFPLVLTWMPGAQEFARNRCPVCGEAEALVAARDRLGCRACTSRPVTPRPGAHAPEAASEPQPGRRISSAADDPVVQDDARVRRDPGVPREHVADEGSRAPARPREGRGVGARSPARIRDADAFKRQPCATPPPRITRGASERIGNKLALDFWGRLARGDRWPRKKVAPDSPLRALHRLYGQAGPLYALGLPTAARPDQVTATTFPAETGGPELTVGLLTAGAADYRYSLSWCLDAGSPLIGEVAPTAHPLALPPARGEARATADRLHERAPAPAADLDPVAAALWRAELGHTGLPFVVRCLATWWRVEASADPNEPAGAVAATIARAIARAAGMPRSQAETASLYETELRDMKRVARDLSSVLRISGARGW